MSLDYGTDIKLLCSTSRIGCRDIMAKAREIQYNKTCKLIANEPEFFPPNLIKAFKIIDAIDENKSFFYPVTDSNEIWLIVDEFLEIFRIRLSASIDQSLDKSLIFQGVDVNYKQWFNCKDIMESAHNNCKIGETPGGNGIDIITDKFILTVGIDGEISGFLLKRESSNPYSISERPIIWGENSHQQLRNYLKEYPALFLDLPTHYFKKENKSALKDLTECVRDAIKFNYADFFHDLSPGIETDFQELMTAITEKCANEKRKAKVKDEQKREKQDEKVTKKVTTKKLKRQVDKALKIDRHK